MTRHHPADIFCRFLGLIVFLLGVGLICWVFVMAYHLFSASPAQVLGLHFTGNPAHDPGVARIGSNFGWLLVRMGFLFLMALAGSLVSQKGINLYFSVCQGAPAGAGVRTHSPSPSPNSESHSE